MSQPPRTEYGRLEDLWRSAPPPGSRTRTIPLSRPGTPPAGMSRPRVRAPRRRFGPLVVELLLAVLVCAGVAVAMGWDVASRLGRAIPGTGEGAYPQLWSLGWAGHALKPGSGVPLRDVFDANAFHPAPLSFAFADHLLGYGPLTWFFTGPSGLVTAYGVLFVAAPAIASLGGYVLARQLGAHPVGATVAAAAIAYAPWRAGQLENLHVLAAGPILIALAMLARGHGFTMSGRRTPPRPLWALLGWLVAAWQLTVGIEVNLPLLTVLALAAALTLLVGPLRWLAGRRRRRRAQRRRVADPYADEDATGPQDQQAPAVRTRRRVLLGFADLAGVAVLVAALALMAYPFLRLDSTDPQALAAARTAAQVTSVSPEFLGLVAPPTTDGTWSRLADTENLVQGPNELRLLPGVLLLELALMGLLLSSWRWWWRALLALAAAAFAALSLGTRFPDAYFPGPDAPFDLLRRDVPGWIADTTPARLVVFTTLALALLAAGAVSRLCGRDDVPRGRPTFLRSLGLLALLVLPALVVVEGWSRIPVTAPPPVPVALARAAAPTIVLPSATTTDGRAMFWSAQRGFPALGNGQGTITPSSLIAMRDALKNFPDAASVSYLRTAGFRSVVVLRNPDGTLPGQPAVPPGGTVPAPQPTPGVPAPGDAGAPAPGVTPTGPPTAPDGSTPEGTGPDGTTPDGGLPDGSPPNGNTPDGSGPQGSAGDDAAVPAVAAAVAPARALAAPRSGPMVLPVQATPPPKGPPPTGTGQPGDPGQPGATTSPGDPTQPGSTAAPGDPGNPGQPGGTGQPDGSGLPGDPAAPGQPGGTGQPGQPGVPGQPGAAIPVDPATLGLIVEDLGDAVLYTLTG